MGCSLERKGVCDCKRAGGNPREHEGGARGIGTQKGGGGTGELARDGGAESGEEGAKGRFVSIANKLHPFPPNTAAKAGFVYRASVDIAFGWGHLS